MRLSSAGLIGFIALVVGGNAGLRAQPVMEQVQAQGRDAVRAQALASQIDMLNRELSRSSQAQAYRLSRLLDERSSALLSLAKLDASRALSLMFQRDEAESLRSMAPGAAVESEGEWTGNAVVVVADDFKQRTAQWMMWLDVAGIRTPIYVAGPQPLFKSGDKISVRGQRLGGAIIAEKANLALVAASAGCPTVGEQEVAAVLVNMPGHPLPPQVTSSFTNQILFSSSPPSLNSYWSEASYGRASAAGQVFGPYDLPQAYACSDDVVSGIYALIAAADSTVDFRKYSRIVMMRDNPPDCVKDYSNIGCLTYNSPSHGPFQASAAVIHWDPSVFLDTSFPEPFPNTHAIVHELGHSLGLYHANSLQFGTQPLGPSANVGTDIVYGDWFDTMGQSIGDYQQPSGLWFEIDPHYDAPHKNQLGWLAADELQTVTSAGTFMLQPFESAAHNNPKALRIPRNVAGANQTLWVEYRQPLGYDASACSKLSQICGGALIHFEDPNTDPLFLGESHVLDFTAAATPGNFRDAALLPGTTWNDPYSALSLTVNSATASALAITVRYDSTTPAPAPVITSVSPSSAAAGAAPFTLTVNGTNFLPGAVVSWNSSALSTTFVSFTQLTAPVTASLVANGGSASIVVANPGGTSSYSNSITFPINTSPPVIAQGGICPASSSDTTIAPGEWVSIYGTGLATRTASWNGDFPTALAGSMVTIDGKAAFISYAGPMQINVQAPDDAASGLVPVVVTTALGSATSSVTLAQYAPSFFLLDGKHVAGVIPRSDGTGAYGGGAYDTVGPTGTSLGYSTVAARPGDIVELFGTGFGPTKPVVPSGQAFSGAAPTTAPVTILINGVTVVPSFAGLSGAGLDQINLTIPAGLGSGDVSLVAIVGGVKTPSNVVITLQSSPTPSSVTIGSTASTDSNAFPFNGTASGSGTRYQQVYGAGNFSGPMSIVAVSFFRQIAGAFRSGTYSLYLSTTSVGVNSLSTQFDGNLGTDATLIATVNLSGATPSVLTFAGGPFAYNPTKGNLLVDIRVSNTGAAGSGGFQAQYTNAGFSRAYDFTSPSSVAAGGLITRFDSAAVAAH